MRAGRHTLVPGWRSSGGTKCTATGLCGVAAATMLSGRTCSLNDKHQTELQLIAQLRSLVGDDTETLEE